MRENTDQNNSEYRNIFRSVGEQKTLPTMQASTFLVLLNSLSYILLPGSKGFFFFLKTGARILDLDLDLDLVAVGFSKSVN